MLLLPEGSSLSKGEELSVFAPTSLLDPLSSFFLLQFRWERKSGEAGAGVGGSREGRGGRLIPPPPPPLFPIPEIG